MKYAVFNIAGETKVGMIGASGDTITPLAVAEECVATEGVTALIALNPSPSPDSESIPLSEVKLLAPVPRPHRNIFCVGKNYHEHAHEFASSGFDSSAAKGAIPEAPIVFSKLPETVIPNGAAITIDPRVSSAIDYEAELGVIIGKEGRSISKEDAMDYVWGYTIINDVTARDLQGTHSQWLIGKSQDTFCPMGPWVVTADEIDLSDTEIKCWVNGELRQNSNTGLLIFDVPTIIAAISNGITLKPGDVIATGTPAGVGIGFKPPKYLTAGDIVKVEISGIGQLENPVEAYRHG